MYAMRNSKSYNFAQDRKFDHRQNNTKTLQTYTSIPFVNAVIDVRVRVTYDAEISPV